MQCLHNIRKSLPTRPVRYNIIFPCKWLHGLHVSVHIPKYTATENRTGPNWSVKSLPVDIHVTYIYILYTYIYPDLVHLLFVTRSTDLRPSNVPSAFSHEPLIYNNTIRNRVFPSLPRYHSFIHTILYLFTAYIVTIASLSIL